MNPTEEQLKNREIALGNIEQGVPQDTGITESISTNDLQTTQDIDFGQSEISPIPSLESLTTDFSSLFPTTETEQKAGGLETRLSELTSQLTGEAAARTEAEQAQDITGKQQLKETER